MQYEEALREWGARTIEKMHPRMKQIVLRPSVKVTFVFNEGNPCCGGTDPHCYCTQAESPSANIKISAYTDKGNQFFESIEMSNYYGSLLFTEILEQILEAGEGSISLE